MVSSLQQDFGQECTLHHPYDIERASEFWPKMRSLSAFVLSVRIDCARLVR